MFTLSFMRNAYLVGTIISILAGIIGVFVVAQDLPFFSHTLSEIGFSGASFAVWLNFSPLSGMMIFTILSAILTNQLDKSKQRSNQTISVVTAFFMGSGILFLSLSKENVSYATNILFGSIVGIGKSEVVQIFVVSIAVILVTFLIYRHLKFVSFDKVGSSLEYSSDKWFALLFLVMLALSVSVASQIVGSLLVFVLLILPAASANFFCRSVSLAIVVSICLALCGTWIGLYLGYITNLPVTFFIAIVETIFYLISLSAKKVF